MKKQLVSISAAVFAIGALAAANGALSAEKTVTYRVSFNGTWSKATHPTEFPKGAHFSGLIGAIVGGYVIAFSEVMVTYAYKKVFVYLLPQSLEPEGLLQLLSTDYKFAVSFVILVLVLLVRPTGIMRGKLL